MCSLETPDRDFAWGGKQALPMDGEECQGVMNAEYTFMGALFSNF